MRTGGGPPVDWMLRAPAAFRAPLCARPRHDRVHGGVLASVAGTAEEDVSHRDLTDRAADDAAPAAPVRRGRAAAGCQRQERSCHDPCCVPHVTTSVPGGGNTATGLAPRTLT